jgi:cell division protein FtsL
MKKTSAILLFFCCNALLIFFEVHKQGQYLTLSYELQKLQSHITLLSKQHSDLTYALQAQQQPHIIQNIAEKQMGMLPAELSKIKVAPQHKTN